eukprot:Gb_41189 [translate_table: standard]
MQPSCFQGVSNCGTLTGGVKRLGVSKNFMCNSEENIATVQDVWQGEMSSNRARAECKPMLVDEGDCCNQLFPVVTHCLLVKGWKSSASWSFPRGKKGKDEEDHACAIREVCVMS